VEQALQRCAKSENSLAMDYADFHGSLLKEKSVRISENPWRAGYFWTMPSVILPLAPDPTHTRFTYHRTWETGLGAEI
jgi:hypothetical protein